MRRALPPPRASQEAEAYWPWVRLEPPLHCCRHAVTRRWPPEGLWGGAGDENGVLHVLDIPRKLRKEVTGEVAHLRAVLGETA